MTKRAGKAKDQTPALSPLQKAVGDVAAARGEFERSIELLEKAQATCKQAYARVQDAETRRAAFVFVSIDEAKTGLMQ